MLPRGNTTFPKSNNSRYVIDNKKFLSGDWQPDDSGNDGAEAAPVPPPEANAMFRLLTITCAAVLFLLPLHARAGGLPLLCLPIDGATADNADRCAQRGAKALGEGIERVGMRQNDGQWYLTFHFNRDRVRLADIDAALKGSPFSVARDKLRLFGDVILEVDARDGSADKLLADLKTQKHIVVSESKREDGSLLVTLAL